MHDRALNTQHLMSLKYYMFSKEYTLTSITSFIEHDVVCILHNLDRLDEKRQSTDGQNNMCFWNPTESLKSHFKVV